MMYVQLVPILWVSAGISIWAVSISRMDKEGLNKCSPNRLDLLRIPTNGGAAASCCICAWEREMLCITHTMHWNCKQFCLLHFQRRREEDFILGIHRWKGIPNAVAVTLKDWPEKIIVFFFLFVHCIGRCGSFFPKLGSKFLQQIFRDIQDFQSWSCLCEIHV